MPNPCDESFEILNNSKKNPKKDLFFLNLLCAVISLTYRETAPALFNEAPDEVKDEFEESVNIFEGGFDDYVAEDSTITVEERRVVVAATTVSAVAAARPAIQPKPIIGTSPAGGPSIPQRRRGS